MTRNGTPAGPSVADIDRRKARVVACLYPTRIKRGFKTRSDCGRLAALLGISMSTLYAWEDGKVMVPDSALPAIEAWLAGDSVWRYAGVGRVVGPETWPEPLRVPSERPVEAAERAF